MLGKWYTCSYKPLAPNFWSLPRVHGAHFVPEQVNSFSRLKYLGSNTWLRALCLSKPLRRYCNLPLEGLVKEFNSEDLFDRLFKSSELGTLYEVKKIAFEVKDNKLLQLVTNRIVTLENSIAKVNYLLIDPVECNLENQFECLCKLASDESWCWQLRCTTCGHGSFRYAFELMSKGVKVQSEVRMIFNGIYRSSGWVVRARNDRFDNQLGVLPMRWHTAAKDKIVKICAKANLEVIDNNCKYPDWRGYLGLVAAHMNSNSDAYKELSINWAKQLLKMDEGEASRVELQKIANGERLLSWRDV